MTPAYTWLWIVLGVEGLILAGCLGLLLGRTVWLRWDALRWDPNVRQVRTALIQALETDATTGRNLPAVHLLPRRIQMGLFIDVAERLSGSHLKELAYIARQLSIVQHGEHLCRSRRWSRRIQGIRLLTALGEGERLIPSLFRDPSPIVRSEVTHWAADHPSPAVIDEVLLALTDADGFCRFAAHNALHRMGVAAVRPLERYIAFQTGTALERAMAVAASSGHEQFSELAGTLVGHSSPVVRKLALDTLARSGDLQSVPLVLDRLNDAEPPVRRAAVRTLGQLYYWQAAPAIGRLLADPVWMVRLEAGAILRSLGAPGNLVLRRALANPDRFVADMARHVLGFPSLKARTEPA
jgi:HEAT repeat protein